MTRQGDERHNAKSNKEAHNMKDKTDGKNERKHLLSPFESQYVLYDKATRWYHNNAKAVIRKENERMGQKRRAEKKSESF